MFSCGIPINLRERGYGQHHLIMMVLDYRFRAVEIPPSTVTIYFRDKEYVMLYLPYYAHVLLCWLLNKGFGYD